MKLKLYKEAELELKQFENFEKREFFYEYQQNSYPNRKGSNVPFGLRVLNAELPLFLGRSDESVSNLYKLLHTVNKIIEQLTKNEENESKFDINFILLWKLCIKIFSFQRI